MRRSWLFVPADSDRKIAKSAQYAPDALILDLEDSVAQANRPFARGRVAAYLTDEAPSRAAETWVRVNPLDTSDSLLDLAAVVMPNLKGIILPKSKASSDVVKLDHYLSALEAKAGMVQGTVKIMPVATERPEALFSLGSYAGSSARLVGLTWGAEDLSAAFGATGNKTATGEWRTVYQLAKSLCLAAAHAADVAPIDTLFDDFRDPEGLRAACRDAKYDGFTGKVAIHPDQVAVINDAFYPTAEEIEEAQRVVEAFTREPNVSVLSIDGRMYDMPHLVRAQRLLAGIRTA